MLKHPEVFAELRDREFARLKDHAYLDYTGSALYAESQIRAHHALLETGLLGNPHSMNAPSQASAVALSTARELLLQFLGVDASTHDVCFTSNATAAIKLVGESYPFDAATSFVLTVDNHNSVNGIREYARRAGATITYLPIDDDLRLRPFSFQASGLGPRASGLGKATGGGPEARGPRPEASISKGLFAFPAQSNFSGVRHPLSLVAQAHAAGFDVLLDAAAYLPAHTLNLRECAADFVALSFYKLFGYPTGIGALVARRDALARLRRPWFSGGTILYASVQADTHRFRLDHEAFEDGTPDFLGIAALPAGFALLAEAGMDRLSEHVAEMTEILLEDLQSLHHGNGRALVRIYGPRDMTDRGCAIAFNVCDREGGVIPFSVVEERARDANVSLRGGCFCNPGASEVAFGLERDRMAACFEAAGDSFTIDKFGACVDSAVGAVRVSSGLATNAADVHKAIGVIASFRE